MGDDAPCHGSLIRARCSRSTVMVVCRHREDDRSVADCERLGVLAMAERVEMARGLVLEIGELDTSVVGIDNQWAGLGKALAHCLDGLNCAGGQLDRRRR